MYIYGSGASAKSRLGKISQDNLTLRQNIVFESLITGQVFLSFRVQKSEFFSVSRLLFVDSFIIAAHFCQKSPKSSHLGKIYFAMPHVQAKIKINP